MTRLYLLLSSIFITGILLGQSVMLSPIEKGRMFHTIEKSPVLKRNFYNFYEYSGDTVWFHYEKKIDSSKFTGDAVLIDYDSMARLIQVHPNTFQVDFQGLSMASTGLLSELASKMALWDLYERLTWLEDHKIEDIEDVLFYEFIKNYTEALPNGVRRMKNGNEQPSKAAIQLLDPNLTFRQRASSLSTFQTIAQPEQKDVINAINTAIRFYLLEQGKEYFSKLSIKSPDFYTSLIAAGDGSGTSGLLDEREKIYKHKNELGESVGVGLYTYSSTFESGHKNRQKLVPLSSDIMSFEAVPDDYTNLHLSMWGFNFNNQTTVAIYREGDMYLLYADKLSKELTPDSTFGQGNTLQKTIDYLEGFAIPKTNEDINGKNGIRAQLEDKDSSHVDVLYKIGETEIKLNELRRNALKNQKKMKRQQQILVVLHERKSYLERKKIELKQALVELEERLLMLNGKLTEYKSYLAYNRIGYTNLGYIYTFEDGCTFNTFTQNFTMPDSLKVNEFDIRLICLGRNAVSKNMDEIQLLTSISKGSPEDFETHDFHLEMADVFKSDQFFLDSLTFKKDELFELTKMMHLQNIHKGDFYSYLQGNGVGAMAEGRVIKSIKKELPSYPGETDEEKDEARESESFKSLRVSYAEILFENNNIYLKVESYTDPVKSRFTTNSTKLKTLKSSYDSITDNELLSAFRSFELMEKLCLGLTRAAYENFEGKERDRLIGKIKGLLKKSEAHIRSYKVKYDQFVNVAHSEKDIIDEIIEQLEKEEEVRLKKLYGSDYKKKKS